LHRQFPDAVEVVDQLTNAMSRMHERFGIASRVDCHASAEIPAPEFVIAFANRLVQHELLPA
jgi:hypothetical protein